MKLQQAVKNPSAPTELSVQQTIAWVHPPALVLSWMGPQGLTTARKKGRLPGPADTALHSTHFCMQTPRHILPVCTQPRAVHTLLSPMLSVNGGVATTACTMTGLQLKQ